MLKAYLDGAQSRRTSPPLAGGGQGEGFARIGWSLRAVIEDDLRAGALKTVLDRYVPKLPPFYLYYPEHNRRLELLRLFIDFLAAKRGSRAVPLQ